MSLDRVARVLSRLGNERLTYFPPGLFRDPIWSMTLAMAIARLESYDVSVSDVCDMSGIPPTTALHHIHRMVKEGHFLRRKHPSDGRVYHLTLSDEMMSSTVFYLEKAKEVMRTTT